MSEWDDDPDDDFIEECRENKRRALDGLNDAKAYYLGGGGTFRARFNAVSLAAFCEGLGITSPRFREYEPTDEDKRILSELGIEA